MRTVWRRMEEPLGDAGEDRLFFVSGLEADELVGALGMGCAISEGGKTAECFSRRGEDFIFGLLSCSITLGFRACSIMVASSLRFSASSVKIAAARFLTRDKSSVFLSETVFCVDASGSIP